MTRLHENGEGLRAAVCPEGAQGEGGAGCPHCLCVAGSVGVQSLLGPALAPWQASGTDGGRVSCGGRDSRRRRLGPCHVALLAPGAQLLMNE